MTMKNLQVKKLDDFFPDDDDEPCDVLNTILYEEKEPLRKMVRASQGDSCFNVLGNSNVYTVNKDR